MATIKELNEAIETIMEECQSHDECRLCPMYMNCEYRFPDEWETIEDGDSDDN